MANEQNLVPFTGADDPRRGHKKKGSKHLSTIIQELNEIDWDKTQLKNKDELKKLYGNNGFKALAHVAFSKAMSGDTKAMEWLAKHGYGDKLNIEVTDSRKTILERYGLHAGETEEAEDRSPQDSA